MGLDVVEIGMGADLSLDLRHFASKAVRQSKDGAPAPDMDACIRRPRGGAGQDPDVQAGAPSLRAAPRRRRKRGRRRGGGMIAAFRLRLRLRRRTRKRTAPPGTKQVDEHGAALDGRFRPGGRGIRGTARFDRWCSGLNALLGEDLGGCRKQDKGRSSPEAKSRGAAAGAVLPFKAAVGSGAPAFAPLCLRTDDKAARVGMPDLSLLSPPATKSAGEESRRQVVGFAQAVARAAAMAPAAPAFGLQSQSQQQTAQQQQQQQQQSRKVRRCWSTELHRQFVAALNQLGGPQVATPKQIRELMKVDGLTNDEVKSHLQKYRLHNRRAPGSGVVSQPIVLVGGLWIPQEQSSSQSGSPHGPLHFSTSGIAVSSAATVSCEEEDGRSESYGWKC
ncbi:unnamed protein product [Miscanthus lutarioriparius]|uniref:HTH myb-type domain-containing protein n=1 Tax=Miscanthus lutarioriparius TaxID=422564 RepID=A0A811NAJ0_9POAL|nr:unnamed protein product [Miscanthus lutarioriparius]